MFHSPAGPSIAVAVFPDALTAYTHRGKALPVNHVNYDALYTTSRRGAVRGELSELQYGGVFVVERMRALFKK